MANGDDRLGGRGCVGRSLSRRVALGLLGVLPFRPRSAVAIGSSTVSFGMTPVCLSYDLDLVDRFRAYLAGKIGATVRVVTRRTYAEITNMLLAGDLDAAWICGYPFVAHRQELELVAVPSWRGRPLYQGYLIVSRDRVDCSSLPDLRDDTHAFSDPDSNSGYLVTAALLAQSGLHPDGFFGKIFFTYSHRDVVRAVATGLADSGSVDGYVWQVMTETEPGLAGKTRILQRSGWMGFPPVAASRARSGARATAALKGAFLGMSGDAAGQAVLRELRLDGFIEAAASVFDPIAAEVATVQSLG